MALMDRNSDENEQNLTDEQKQKIIDQHRERWVSREKNYLSEMSEEEQFAYYVYKQKISEINRQQLLILHEEMYLYSKRLQKLMKYYAKKALVQE